MAIGTSHRIKILLSVGIFVCVLGLSTQTTAQQGSRAAQIAAMPNPYMLLIRDPAVHSDLKLSARQKAAMIKVTDELDQPLLSLRNKTAASVDKAFQDIVDKARG